jgi:uncharacterized protein (DUF58 family)
MDLEQLRHKMVRQNRIYIMPSGRGMMFLGAIVVVILTAATYNNNLIFILGFFMFSVFVVSMLQTHYNIKGVRLDFASAEEGFTGDPLTVTLHLTQKRAKWKRGLEIRTGSKRIPTLSRRRVDLDPKETAKLCSIDVRVQDRGVWALPPVILETFYPLGLFRAWKVFRFDAQLTVYPRPDTSQVLVPRSFESGQEDLGLRTSPEGDFGELKAYLQGESYHQIAWKHYARTGDLYTKVHWGEDHKHYVIPWSVSGKDQNEIEAALKRLSGWIKTALDENASFEMETPSLRIDPGRGLDQARKCWRQLAEYKVKAGA